MRVIVTVLHTHDISVRETEMAGVSVPGAGLDTGSKQIFIPFHPERRLLNFQLGLWGEHRGGLDLFTLLGSFK